MICKNKNVDGSTLYDALKLAFNSIDKASMLKDNNVDIVQSIHNKAVRNDVYNKSDTDLKFPSLFGAAPAVLNTSVELATALGNDSNYATAMQNQINNKDDKLDTCPKADINVASGILQAGITQKVGITVVDIDGKFEKCCTK